MHRRVFGVQLAELSEPSRVAVGEPYQGHRKFYDRIPSQVLRQKVAKGNQGIMTMEAAPRGVDLQA